VRRGGLLVLLTGGLALAAFTWWPNGEYRPIQPGEKGTVASAARAVQAVPTGRPALTPERERELHGAPTVREHGNDFTKLEPAASTPAGETTAPDATSTTPDTTTTPATTVPAETTPADPAAVDPAAVDPTVDPTATVPATPPPTP
jgi:hypothetical protein